jgi:hypothetical protein
MLSNKYNEIHVVTVGPQSSIIEILSLAMEAALTVSILAYCSVLKKLY